ncbi:hypothetical protein L596_019127 [Steinernema carpocapsae]|uniref:Uncharacterized protein n=1 Tax=Steinernema carpocapsae TaxID=34508 RepID=A0A4U5N7H8_STECR|nr:hypothetical protein L596_019127 [Steinernema carpocapsae]
MSFKRSPFLRTPRLTIHEQNSWNLCFTFPSEEWQRNLATDSAVSAGLPEKSLLTTRFVHFPANSYPKLKIP